MIVSPNLVVFGKQVSLTINLIIAFHPAWSWPCTAIQKDIFVWNILSHFYVGYLVKYVILSQVPSFQIDISFSVTIGVGSVRKITATNIDPSNIIFWTFFRIIGLKRAKTVTRCKKQLELGFALFVVFYIFNLVAVYSLIRFFCDSEESFAIFIPAASVKAPPNPYSFWYFAFLKMYSLPKKEEPIFNSRKLSITYRVWWLPQQFPYYWRSSSLNTFQVYLKHGQRQTQLIHL